jgi:hypothetical protein
MRSPLRPALILVSLLCGLGATCGGSRPPAAVPVRPVRLVAPPAATELVLPPPAHVTICQRAANPTTGGDAEVVASFEHFSRDWIAKMKAIAAARFPTDRKQLRDAYEMELRSTGSTLAPYVGVLSYCELQMQCAGGAEPSCKPMASTVVKEMFRFQAGQWVY